MQHKVKLNLTQQESTTEIQMCVAYVATSVYTNKEKVFFRVRDEVLFIASDGDITYGTTIDTVLTYYTNIRKLGKDESITIFGAQ